MLSQRALQLLAQMFSPESNMQIPAGLADVAVELRTFANAKLAEAHVVVAPEAPEQNEKKSPFRRMK